MGELYDRMARDLKLKNYAAGTQAQYLKCCSGFVRYHMKSPERLGESDIKEYLDRLLLLGGSPEKLKMHVAGLKFLYGETLNRPEVVRRIPWPKVPVKKPDILSGTDPAGGQLLSTPRSRHHPHHRAASPSLEMCARRPGALHHGLHPLRASSRSPTTPRPSVPRVTPRR